jgi:hypothetical protein
MFLLPRSFGVPQDDKPLRAKQRYSVQHRVQRTLRIQNYAPGVPFHDSVELLPVLK